MEDKLLTRPLSPTSDKEKTADKHNNINGFELAIPKNVSLDRGISVLRK
jgi:hypothetical protein